LDSFREKHNKVLHSFSKTERIVVTTYALTLRGLARDRRAAMGLAIALLTLFASHRLDFADAAITRRAPGGFIQ
jgi:hypothetical protein